MSVLAAQVLTLVESQKGKLGASDCIHCQNSSHWYVCVSERALGLVWQMKWSCPSREVLIDEGEGIRSFFSLDRQPGRGGESRSVPGDVLKWLTSVRQCLSSLQQQIQAKVTSGYVYAEDWAAQLIPLWTLLAELISRTQLLVLVPATPAEGNKEPSYYFTFYAET